MANESRDKVERVLDIYTKLQRGELVSKSEEAAKYHVAGRSIQRDLSDIRRFLEKEEMRTGVGNVIIYDRDRQGYYLEQPEGKLLSNSEILAVCKILLDSRAFTKKEMKNVLGRLVDCCVPEGNKKVVHDLIRNEAFHYVELSHKKDFLDTLWDVGLAVRHHQYIEMEYKRSLDKKVVKRKVMPAAVMFSEFYFYLTAFIEDEDVRKKFDVPDDLFPTIYRIDRIQSYKVLDEHFHIPYKDRFEEGEFRKRIQFMYGGKLQKVKFVYAGPDIEAILDRLPTAKVLSEEDGKYMVEAEVFGKGIEMWMRAQGENIVSISDVREQR